MSETTLHLTHDDFQQPTGIPGHPDPPPGEIAGWECYALEYGPVLIGPFPVIVRESLPPAHAGKFILAGEWPYWHRYGDEDCWGQSAYYLRFVPAGTRVVFDEEGGEG